MSILEELKWRGLIADCTDAAELEMKIAAPVTLYCGFDPTADSLLGQSEAMGGFVRGHDLGHAGQPTLLPTGNASARRGRSGLI